MKKYSSMLGNSLSPSAATLGVLGLAFMVTALNANVTSLRGKVAPMSDGGEAPAVITPMQRFDTQIMLDATKTPLSFGDADAGFVSAAADWFKLPEGFDTKSVTGMMREGQIQQPGMVAIPAGMPQAAGGNGMSAGMQAPASMPAWQNPGMDSSAMHGAAGATASVQLILPSGDSRSAGHQTPTASAPSMGTSNSEGHGSPTASVSSNGGGYASSDYPTPTASSPSNNGGTNSSHYMGNQASVPSGTTGNNSSQYMGAQASVNAGQTGMNDSAAYMNTGMQMSVWSDQGQFNASTGNMQMGAMPMPVSDGWSQDASMPAIPSGMQMPHAAAATPGAMFADVVGEILSMPGVLLSVPTMILSIAF